MISKRIFFLAVALVLFIGTVTAQWTQIREGIDYREYTLTGPNNVFVTRMDRSNTDCIIDSCIAQGTLTGGKERVSGMANRYDETIGYWGQSWGQRYEVVAAINGDGFSTIQPTGGQIISGWYAKRFGEFYGGGFVWTLNRGVFMGECVRHISNKNIIAYPATGQKQNINGINVSPGADEIVIFTPQYGNSTGTGAGVSEVLVEMPRPLLIMPLSNYVTGHVSQVRASQGNTSIPFDHLVLSATGSAESKLLSNVSVGDEIRISQEITHYKQDCSTPNSGDYSKAYCTIGFMAFMFLKDGVVQPTTNHDIHPRTAVAYNDDYIFFVVVDGRDAGVSIGMTYTELGNFCKNDLGATWGVNQDGGGSSTMWVDGDVKNNPSDGSERYVTNGLMMIRVQPTSLSTTFDPTDSITASSSTQLRLGPGTLYGSITTLSPGQSGSVLDHSINGVLAKGQYWWKTDFGGNVGWVSESSINHTVVDDWSLY